MVQNPNSVPGDEYLPYPAVAPVAFFGLKQTTRPRNWCLKVACSVWLDYGSRLMALLSCAIVCLYEPFKETSNLLTILEHLTFSFFIMEMLVKMVALGVFGHPGSYLSNNWNKFEVLINTVYVVDYFLAFLGMNWQISKPLEPMRLISRMPSCHAGGMDRDYVLCPGRSFLFSFIVFIPVTIMGSFVMMNVCTVVIVNQFAESRQRDKGQRPAGATSIAWLCDMLASCLRVIGSIYKRTR